MVFICASSGPGLAVSHCFVQLGFPSSWLFLLGVQLSWPVTSCSLGGQLPHQVKWTEKSQEQPWTMPPTRK